MELSSIAQLNQELIAKNKTGSLLWTSSFVFYRDCKLFAASFGVSFAFFFTAASVFLAGTFLAARALVVAFAFLLAIFAVGFCFVACFFSLALSFAFELF